MSFIEVIQPEKAEGTLDEIYQELVRSRGKLAEVHKIQSLNPQTIRDHMNLYMTVMFGKSPLRRAVREMIAVVVSAANQCPYCMKHHGDALNHFWKDPERVENLKQDPGAAGLSEKELRMAEFARNLTLQPGMNREQEAAKLKNAGLSDREILDLNLVISYFNFVNRMVLGLGVELETDGGGGYHYE